MPPSAIANSCTDLWNPVEGARVIVPLSGVLAGFMFSAIVIIITVNRPNSRGETEASYALRLQVVALLTTIVMASTNVNIAGEQICLRARTEWVMSAGLLWMAVVLSSISLVWLMIAYGWNSPQIIRLWAEGRLFRTLRQTGRCAAVLQQLRRRRPSGKHVRLSSRHLDLHSTHRSCELVPGQQAPPASGQPRLAATDRIVLQVRDRLYGPILYPA